MIRFGQIRQEQIKGKSTHDTIAQQLEAAGKPYHKEITLGSADPKQTFTLDKDYEMGVNQLKVFVNGQLQNEGAANAYVEVDQTTVRFNEPLNEGDVVVFRIEGAGSGYGAITTSSTGGSSSSIVVNGTTLTGTIELAAGDNVEFTVDEVNNKITVKNTLVLPKSRKYRQPVNGNLDGVNRTFVIPEPIVAGSEEVYLDGVLQNFGADNDYTIIGQTITFNEPAPDSLSIILVSYDPK